MAWDDDQNGKDPWGGKKNQDGPPSLEEMLRRLKRKMGVNKSSSGSGGSKDTNDGGVAAFGVGLIIVLALIAWLVSGIVIVAPAERSVVLRFGKYLETMGPGPHWLPRFIDSNYTVNVQRVATFSYTAEMLTKDENIVSVSVAVQYRVGSARDVLFNVANPHMSLQQATASALRQVVGQTTLDDILTTGRQVAREQVDKQLSKILNMYRAGLVVTDVTLQPAKPPEQVTEAFDDAIKAREDEQRYINKAKAYAEKVVPIAQGRAARVMQEADAFGKQVVLKSQADTAQFNAILPQYQKAPQVTRERLYLDALESVLSKSSKILVDVKGSNNVFYLPLDRLMHSELNKMSSKTASGVGQATSSNGDAGDITANQQGSSIFSSERFQARQGYTNGASINSGRLGE